MIEHLKRDIERLKTKREELISGLAEMDDNINKLLGAVLEIGIKFPEQKEFIDFVILLNDSTTRSIKDIKSHMLEVVDILIRCKITMVDCIEDEKEKSATKKALDSMVGAMKKIFVNKFAMMYIFGFICLVLYLIFPSQMEHFIGTLLPKIFGKG